MPSYSDMRINLNELHSIIAEALRNAYDVLGLRPGATDDEIKKAWRALAIQNHPDRGGSHGKMVDINNAKDRLLDKSALFRYGSNIKGYEDPKPQPQAAPPRPPQSAPQPPPRTDMRGCPYCGRSVAVKDGKYVNHYDVAGGSRKCPNSGYNANRWYEERWEDSGERPGWQYNDAGQYRRKPASGNQHPGPQPSSSTGAPQGQASSRAKRDAHGQPSKDSYKVYGWRQGRRVVRVGGKLFGTEPGGRLKTGGNTAFQANEKAKVRPDGTKMKVKKQTSDHTQTWDPIDEVRQTIDSMIMEMIMEIADRPE